MIGSSSYLTSVKKGRAIGGCLCSGSGGGGVTSLNGETGGITILGTGGTTVTNVGPVFTINSTGGTGGPFLPLAGGQMDYAVGNPSLGVITAHTINGITGVPLLLDAAPSQDVNVQATNIRLKTRNAIIGTEIDNKTNIKVNDTTKTITLNTTSLPLINNGFTFNNVMSFNNAESQLVDVARLEQVPTNQIAVPKRSNREDISSTTIDDINPPIGPFYTFPFFTWNYSGTGTNSQFCTTDLIEADISISAWGGGLDLTIQWGVVLRDLDTSTPYYSEGPFTFDFPAGADTTSYSTRGNRISANAGDRFNHTARILCEFKGTTAILDGSKVQIELYALSSLPGPFTIDRGYAMYSLRPINLFP